MKLRNVNISCFLYSHNMDEYHLTLAVVAVTCLIMWAIIAVISILKEAILFHYICGFTIELSEIIKPGRH